MLDNETIGVKFENRLRYSEDFNAYLFRSFYNGAGVALADLNNDGNLDLLLCGNQVDNKLYLGNGRFGFTDITKTSGLDLTGSWTTGVSIVDINGDGWKDIYICKSGPLSTQNRRNELFINKGTDAHGQLHFIESAKEYGIDDLGFSIHAIFFDYDHDGDLDMYLSSNSAYPSDVIMSVDLGMRDKTGGGSKLYKNIGNYFVDVTKESGIYNSPIGFGLGIAAGDVNRDGWVDLYVANDFFEKDYLYINQHDGTFKESINDLTNEISLGAMGVDISDINHDGYPEIFVTEMLPEDETRIKTKVVFDSWDQYSLRASNGYHRQFPRNTLQLNLGSNPGDSSVHFSEISRYANVAATDWSWGVQMVDLDNDGQKEIFVTNGIGKDLLDRDFLSDYDSPERLRELFKTKGVVMSELFDRMPSQPIANYLFKLDSNLVFKNAAKNFGLDQAGFSTGSAYGDIDNDGDLDLVVNNINGPPFIYRNELPHQKNHFISIKLQNKNGITAIGAQLSLWAGGKLFFEELYPMRGAMSTVDDRVLIGLGQTAIIDSIKIQWPAGEIEKESYIKPDQFITIRQSGEKSNERNGQTINLPFFSEVKLDKLGIDFCHQESKFVDFDKDVLLYQMYSNEGPKLAVADINADHRDDFFVGNARGMNGCIFQQGAKSFMRTSSLAMQTAVGGEQQHALFFDADNDGDQDLIIASGSYEFPNGAFALTDKLYFNDGKGNFTASTEPLPIGDTSSTSVIVAADYDGDGDLDLFIGGRFRQEAYGLPVSSYLLENNGKGIFSNVTRSVAPSLLNIGMVTDAVWSDIDRDGDPDLIVVGEWMPIRIFGNEKGRFTERVLEGLRKSNGFWNTIVRADLDGDGDDDFIVGNLGDNTFFKACYDRPVRMYVNDFDKNGSIDQVITTYRDNVSYPVAMKDLISERLPYLQKKYLRFSSYSGQTINDIFSKKLLDQSIMLTAYVTASSVLWNDNGKFELKPLPFEAQLTTTYAIVTMDINNDGHEDIILGGNQYRAKPQTGIYAGSYGSVLLNNANRSFQALSPSSSGFFVKGEIRDIKKINFDNKDLLLVARNDDSMKIFKLNR